MFQLGSGQVVVNLGAQLAAQERHAEDLFERAVIDAEERLQVDQVREDETLLHARSLRCCD